MKKVILPLALLALPVASHADWTPVLDKPQEEILLDPAVKRTGDKTLRLTYRTRDKRGNFSADMTIDADCSDFSYHVVKAVWTETKVREEVKYPDVRVVATPKTDVYAVIKAACAGAKKPE